LKWFLKLTLKFCLHIIILLGKWFDFAMEEEEEEIEETKGTQADGVEEENKKLKETLMRTLAELDNTRRRSADEKDKMAKYAIGKFAEDLIPVMENFYMAFLSVSEEDFNTSPKVKTFFDGIKMTQSELKKAFERHGLIRLYPLNEPFNPDLHEAISQLESDEPEGTILQVLQAGYMIKERLLRPALVAVAKPKS